VIIDTPPGRSSESVAAVEAADLVLIPFEAEDIDAYDGVPKTARLARSSGKPAIGILNKATPNSRSQAETARYVLDEIKLPMAPVVLHRYRQHRDANPKGLTAQELEPDSRAAAEVSALWDWICAELQLTTGAQVHTSRRKAS